MKIIVISDTHGRAKRVREVLDRHPMYDMLLFLGDGVRDVSCEELGGLSYVRGNCDGIFSLDGDPCVPTEREMYADGFKLLMMHGHEWGVKQGIERAAAHAAGMDADVLLYGHTHIPMEKYYPEGSAVGEMTLTKPLYVFNPGSLGKPMNTAPSFGVIEIKKGQLLLSHGYLYE